MAARLPLADASVLAVAARSGRQGRAVHPRRAGRREAGLTLDGREHGVTLQERRQGMRGCSRQPEDRWASVCRRPMPRSTSGACRAAGLASCTARDRRATATARPGAAARAGTRPPLVLPTLRPECPTDGWRGQAGGRRPPKAKAGSRKASKTGRCFGELALCTPRPGAVRAPEWRAATGAEGRRLNLGAQVARVSARRRATRLDITPNSRMQGLRTARRPAATASKREPIEPSTPRSSHHTSIVALVAACW